MGAFPPASPREPEAAGGTGVYSTEMWSQPAAWGQEACGPCRHYSNSGVAAGPDHGGPLGSCSPLGIPGFRTAPNTTDVSQGDGWRGVRPHGPHSALQSVR